MNNKLLTYPIRRYERLRVMTYGAVSRKS